MFEAVVLPHGAPAWRRRWRVGPLAVGAHALLIGGALLSALRNGEDLFSPNPPTPVVFIPPRIPASLGGPPPPAGTRSHPGASVRPVPVVRIPREIPDAIASAEDLDDGNASWQDSDLPDGAGPPGDPDGVDGGTGEIGACPTCPGGGTIHEVGGDIAAPRLLHKVEPVYPEVARKLRIQGFVIARAIIGLDGRVEDVRIEKTLHPSLDEATLDALTQWRYRPATLSGRAVRVALTVTVRFELK